MRKQTEIAADIIAELRKLADSLQEMADCSRGETKPAADSDPAPEKKPDSPPPGAVTLERVRTALASLSVAGHGTEVRNLIAKFGAARLSDIAPEHLAEVLKEAESIG